MNDLIIHLPDFMNVNFHSSYEHFYAFYALRNSLLIYNEENLQKIKRLCYVYLAKNAKTEFKQFMS